MKKGLIFILGLVVGLCLVAGGYFAFNNLSGSEIKIVKKEVKKEKGNKKEESKTLDLDSKLVIDLASKVNIIDNRSTCSLTEKAQKLSSQEKWTVKDLQDEYKMFLAYRQVGMGNFKNYIYCLDYDDISKDNGICGDPSVRGNDVQNGTKNYTTTVNEKVLKMRYEEIFGEGTYKKVAYFSLSDGLSYDMAQGVNGYAYSPSHKEYVMTQGEGGGACGPSPISKLTTANQEGNKVYLTERIISNDQSEEKFDVNLKYTFEKEESTGNYIFKSIENI